MLSTEYVLAMRNTLDLAAIPYLKEKSHLPVIVDPSHATGAAALIKPVSLAATVVGAVDRKSVV